MSTINDANVQIRRLVQRVLGLSDGFMRPANQRADAGHQGGPFGTVLIMSAEDVGTVARTTEDDGAGGLNEVLQVPVRIVASVQFFKSAAKPGYLRGGGASAAVGSYTGITAGGFDVMIDGTLRQVSGLNFAGAADVGTVAARVQTALAALVPATTCIWTGKRFIVTSPTTTQASGVTFAAPPTAGGSPTDVSTLLALTDATGAARKTNATGVADYSTDAFDLAVRLSRVLQLGQHGSYMQAVGLGFLGATRARDMSGISDAAWESRGSVDLTFNFIAREVAAVPSITPPYATDFKALQPGGVVITKPISVTPH